MVGDRVRLAWVLVDGALRPVAGFSGVRPRERPPATCPVCRERVTLKLGPVVAPHAAHRGGSHCPLEWEETALHFNTKHALASALRVAAPGTALRLRYRCVHRGGVLGETIWAPGLVPCAAILEETLVDGGAGRGWDEVRVEAGLSDARPDVLLLARGEPVAAIEVRRTHAVTAEKVERLAASGVPWAEVVAARSLYAEFTAWTAGAPLTVLRSSARARWACDYHRGRDRRRGEAPADAPLVARVVDRYLPDGRAVRELLYVAGVASGGRVRGPTLRRRYDDVPLAVLGDGPRARVLGDAHEAFLAWAARRRALGERVDSPMSWLDARRLHSDEGWHAGTALFPRRFVRDAASGAWRRRPRVGERPWALAELLGEAGEVRGVGRSSHAAGRRPR